MKIQHVLKQVKLFVCFHLIYKEYNIMTEYEINQC